MQKIFVEEYEILKNQAENKEIHLLFFDPTHQVHNTVFGRCWQEKGLKGTLVLPSNTGRKRTSILGAMNSVSLQFTSVVTEDNCDQYMMQETLKQIRKEYPDGKKIVLILDNASYNRAYSVRDAAKELNIELKFLPPYCPNLNLIERIWKFMKKKILSCTYYPTFSEFQNAIHDFCSGIEIYHEEIKTLFSQKFEIIKAV